MGGHHPHVMAVPELFRAGPPEGWQREVAQQGFVLLPGALTEAAAEALTSEVLATEEAAPVVAGTAQSGSARGAHAICGPVADALLDAPLLRSMLGDQRLYNPRNSTPGNPRKFRENFAERSAP